MGDKHEVLSFEPNKKVSILDSTSIWMVMIGIHSLFPQQPSPLWTGPSLNKTLTHRRSRPLLNHLYRRSETNFFPLPNLQIKKRQHLL